MKTFHFLGEHVFLMFIRVININCKKVVVRFVKDKIRAMNPILLKTSYQNILNININTGTIKNQYSKKIEIK